MTKEQRMCEDATGCRENPRGPGKFYSSESAEELSPALARKCLEQRVAVAVPNAGAGSYGSIFSALGFDEVKVVDWTSSAGDWSFAVRQGHDWFLASQSNRFPGYGFSYYVDFDWQFESFEAACEFASQ